MSDQPPEKPTTQLPAVPAWAIELTRTVKEGFARSEANDALIAVEVKRAQSDIRGLATKVSHLEEWRGAVEGTVMPRLDTHSIKVQRISDHDMEQESKIADMLVFQSHVDNRFTSQDKRLEVIEKKTDAQTVILTDIRDGAKALFKNPKFLALIAAAYTALMYWLGKHGGVP